jgi:hypothetical protein
MPGRALQLEIYLQPLPALVLLVLSAEAHCSTDYTPNEMNISNCK